MKILPYLLINLVMVGGGIVAYDQIKSDDVGSASETGGVDPVDLAQIEDRIVERLNGADQPVLRASGIDPRLLARIAALEKQLGGAPAAASDGAAAVETEGLSSPEPMASMGDEVEPSEEEVKRFRKVMERAEQMRREEREVERMQQMLARLEIELNPQQQKKLLTAQRNFRTKVGETFREAMRGGGGREAAREAMDGLRQEFTTVLTEFMSVGDAQKITESGGGMRGFRGRDGGAPAAPPRRGR